MQFDGVEGAVTDADQLLDDVMSTRGYPVSDFEQRVADISTDHPLVLDNYRVAHHTAVRKTRGLASTEDLRRPLFITDPIWRVNPGDNGGESKQRLAYLRDRPGKSL
jgi:hypothetical protein